MMLIDLISSFAHIVLIYSVAFGQTGGKEDRRRQSSNEISCNEIDYNRDSFLNCVPFLDETFWNEEFLQKICHDTKTDKSITAKLCPGEWYSSNADYYRGLKLAILNTMYGEGVISPDTCPFYCMFDPRNLQGASAVGFRWNSDSYCWNLLTKESSTLCYTTGSTNEPSRGFYEWQHQLTKTWCPGRICKVYGDPHVNTFHGISWEETRTAHGDFVLYRSSTLRIDVRFEGYIRDTGVRWHRVTGVHSAAIQVIGGDCEVKIEIYNKHQTQSGETEFLFNDDKVEWEDLQGRFDACDEICSNKYEVDEGNDKVSITFADKVVVTMTNVEGMQSLYVFVPYETFGNDDILLNETQLCMGTYRKLDCKNDTTILTNNPFDSELGKYVNCEDRDSPSFNSSSFDCDLNILRMGEEVCTCNIPCRNYKLEESCAYDICRIPMIMEDYNSNNREAALEAAKKVADEYCGLTEMEVQKYPLICNDSDRPTRVPLPFPTRSPTRVPTSPPSPDPTVSPTKSPTMVPSPSPSRKPTVYPTEIPTQSPSEIPTEPPSPSPTLAPTDQPTSQPTPHPTDLPTNIPTSLPTEKPTGYPSNVPTRSPTRLPSKKPTWSPTDYQHCAYLAHEHQACLLTPADFVDIRDFNESDFDESGVQYCAEKCFREDSNWFHYTTNKCRCIIGSCNVPLDKPSVFSVYRILPCELKCANITSEEWWGQSPTSTESLNGDISPKPVKGIRFTSEIYAEIHMLAIDMKLSNENTILDETLRLKPVLYLAGENVTLVVGDSDIPAFIDGYDGKFGSMAKVFLKGNIYQDVPYTIAFEFVSGQAEVMVSLSTHYYHDGGIADDVFGVKGTSGSEPQTVDTNAPHVVVCYVDVECTPKNQVLNDDVMRRRCPGGFGATEKTIRYAQSCQTFIFMGALIQDALAYEFYDDCESYCLFDTNWPLRLNWRWNEEDECWNALYGIDGCEVEFPDVAQRMYTKAAELCDIDHPPTSLPTPFDATTNSSNVKCNQTTIDNGSHVLLSIDSAYNILTEVCDVIGSDDIALLDGGYIYGSDCSAVKTNEVRNYTLMFCASAEGYCDFEDLLLSPNFDVDVHTSLVLVQLTDLLQGIWADGDYGEWGFHITMRKSLKLNAVGIYMNHFAQIDSIIFSVKGYGVLSAVPLPRGSNAVARWYFAIIDDIQLNYESSYLLLWKLNVAVAASSALYINTMIRVYTDVSMPIEVEDGFAINSFVTVSAGQFTGQL